MAERSLAVTNMDMMLNLFGSYDGNIRIIQSELGVDILSRGGDIRITGPERGVEKAYNCINGLLKVAERGENITEQQVRYFITMADSRALRRRDMRYRERKDNQAQNSGSEEIYRLDKF